MKKHLYTFICLFSVIFYINGQKIKIIRETNYSNEEVEEYVEIPQDGNQTSVESCFTHEKYPNLKIEADEETEYCSTGKIVRKTIFDCSQQTVQIDLYDYNDQGDLFKHEAISENQTKYIKTLYYDNKNRVIQINDSSNFKVEKTTISYPEPSLTKNFYFLNGMLSYQTDVIIDSINKVEKRIDYFNDSVESVEIKYHDQDWKLKNITLLDNNHNPVKIEEFKRFDSYHVKKTTFPKQKITKEYYFEKDSVNNTKEVRHYFNEILELRFISHFNKYNDCILTEFFDAESTESPTNTRVNRYKYDKYNNWTEMRTFYGDSLESICYRQIQYF